MNLEEIKSNLQHGDMAFLAKSTDKSVELVKKVLAGKRKNTKIIAAARMLIEGRKSLGEQISIMASA